MYSLNEIDEMIDLLESYRTEKPEIRKVVDKIVEDPTPNFWDIILYGTSSRELKKKAHEERYSAMISWLMDPNENHNLANMFIRELLIELHKSDEDEISKINKYFSDDNKQKVTVLTEFERIDVYYKNKVDNVHVAIEVKQYASEHNRGSLDISQLEYYKNIVDSEADKINPNESCKYFLFLTPLGVEASAGNDDWISVSYENVVTVLDKMIGQNHDLDFIKIVKDFKQELKRTNMTLDVESIKKLLQDSTIENRDQIKNFYNNLTENQELNDKFSLAIFKKGLNEEKIRETLTLINNSLYVQNHTENMEVQDIIMDLIKHFTKVEEPVKSKKYDTVFKDEYSDIIFKKVATTRGKAQGIKFFYEINDDVFWTYYSGDSKGFLPNDGFGVFRNKELIGRAKIEKMSVIEIRENFESYLEEFSKHLLDVSDQIKRQYNL